MYILGINAFHADSSACLIEDGRLVAAVEEERFRRIKHWAGLPSMAIDYCLKSANLNISQVDHIAVNQDSAANLREKVRYSLTHTPDLGLVMDRIRNKKKRSGIVEQLRAEYPDQDIRAEFHPVEHHVAHLSSAFHCSPFETATTVSVDGFGDFASTAWGLGEGPDIALETDAAFAALEIPDEGPSSERMELLSPSEAAHAEAPHQRNSDRSSQTSATKARPSDGL